jgi:hypothetical protein
MKTKTGLEFLLASLPQDDRKAMARIRDVRDALLKKYDRHVLHRYTIGQELRYLLERPKACEGAAYFTEREWYCGDMSPKQLAENLLRPKTPRLAKLRRYVARRSFLQLLEQDAAIAVDGCSEREHKINAYVLRRSYLTIAHMIANAAPARK